MAQWPFILIVASVLTLFPSLFLVFVDARPPNHNTSTTKKSVLLRDERTGLKQILFKPLLYYLQSLNLLLSTRGIRLWMSPVLSVFNFSFEAVGGENAGICWSHGLDAVGEILLNLLVPALITLHMFTPRLFVDAKGNGTALCCKRQSLCGCSKYNAPYVAGAVFRVMLISIGVLLTVCFKLLAVAHIEGKWLMFYNADKQAFGGWWFGGLLGVCLVLTVFAGLFLNINNQDHRYSSKSIYSKFVRSYKAECWFWEFVIFSRRLCISCFTALQFVGGRFVEFAFLSLLVVYFGLQIRFEPFAYDRVNQVETVCLGLLIAATLVVSVVREDDDDAFVSWILTLCMIVPFLIILWAVSHTITATRSLKAMDERDLHLDTMDNVLRRNPKSLKDVLAQSTRTGNLKSLSTRKTCGSQVLSSATTRSPTSDEVSSHK